MPKEPYNPNLRSAILEVVNNQLREGTPPETRTTLERLIRQGYSRERALELIAWVVSCEIFDVLKSGQPYNADRYLAGLNGLPRLPWEND